MSPIGKVWLDGFSSIILQVEKAISRPRRRESLIVGDDSPNKTRSLAEELCWKNQRIRLIPRMADRGLGFAVIDRFSAAQGEGFGLASQICNTTEH